MKQSAYSKAQDQRVADEVGDDRHLMCSARGCPRRWTTHGDRGKACSAHYWADPIDWPQITADVQRLDVDRAVARRQGSLLVQPLTREQRSEIIARLSGVGRAPSDPKAWALRLRDKHERGEPLTQEQIAAYRSALPCDGWSGVEAA